MCEGPIDLPARRSSRRGARPRARPTSSWRASTTTAGRPSTRTRARTSCRCSTPRWEVRRRPDARRLTKRMLHLAVDDAVGPGRLLPVLLLPRGDPARAAGHAHTRAGGPARRAARTTGTTTRSSRRVERARPRPDALARRHPRARARHRRDERLLQRHVRAAARQPAEHRRRAARLRRGRRRRDVVRRRRQGRAPDAAEAAAARRPRHHPGARGVPVPRRRGRVGRHAGRRHTGAGRATRWCRRWPSPRSSTTRWPTRTAPTCPSVCCGEPATTSGLDAGNSKTVALVVDGERGRARAWARGVAATSTAPRTRRARSSGPSAPRSPTPASRSGRSRQPRSGWPASTGPRTRSSGRPS